MNISRGDLEGALASARRIEREKAIADLKALPLHDIGDYSDREFGFEFVMKDNIDALVAKLEKKNKVDTGVEVDGQ